MQDDIFDNVQEHDKIQEVDLKEKWRLFILITL